MNPTKSYAEKQERKRKLTSVGITAGLYLLAFAVGFALEILNPREEDYSNLTVMLTMPGPTTNDIGLGSYKPSEEGEIAEKIEPSAPKKTEAVLEKAEAPKVDSPKKPVEEAAPAPSRLETPAAPPPPQAPVQKPLVAVASEPDSSRSGRSLGRAGSPGRLRSGFRNRASAAGRTLGARAAGAGFPYQPNFHHALRAWQGACALFG